MNSLRPYEGPRAERSEPIGERRRSAGNEAISIIELDATRLRRAGSRYALRNERSGLLDHQPSSQ